VGAARKGRASHAAQDHHRHRSRAGRRRRHPPRAGLARARGAGHHRRGRQRAPGAHPANARKSWTSPGRPSPSSPAATAPCRARSSPPSTSTARPASTAPSCPSPAPAPRPPPRRGLPRRDAAARGPRHRDTLPAGTLTNIATAFRRAPDIVDRVEEIVLMGGGFFEGGNITPAAEFNIYVDPEAADIVLRSAAPSRSSRSTAPTGPSPPAPGRPLPRHGNPGGRGRSPDGSTSSSASTCRSTAPKAAPPRPLRDRLPAAPRALPGPPLQRGGRDRSELTRGMTVADWWGVTTRPGTPPGSASGRRGLLPPPDGTDRHPVGRASARHAARRARPPASEDRAPQR
jgi:hypothetical protein